MFGCKSIRFTKYIPCLMYRMGRFFMNFVTHLGIYNLIFVTGIKNDANSEAFVVGPKFCGGALSKGGNVIGTAMSDDVGGIVTSKTITIPFII